MMSKHASKKVKKPKKKAAPAVVAARVLIALGFAFILFALGYEAANYPWRIYILSDEELNAINLPDPPPPVYHEAPVIYRPAEKPAEKPAESPSAEPVLPGEDSGSSGGPQTVLGFIKIPKLNVSVNIMDGYGASQLLLGAGHVTGTPMPGGEGNVCIAGHRVTNAMHPFRHLELMKQGDLVFIHYQDHVYTYKTLSVFVVGNKETWVMQPVADEPRCLTLIACHPPTSARQRIILRGRLYQVDGQPLA